MHDILGSRAPEIRVASLCAGVGGLDYGYHHATGGRTTTSWYAEYDPDASTVLAARLPGVRNIGDITTADWAALPRVDTVLAGFPCQPVSAAGRQMAQDDHRWLWPHVRAAIQVLRPQEVLLENVRNLISIQKGAVFAGICEDLRADGYGVRWATMGACAVGGCHHRHRVFVVARYAWALDPGPAVRVPVAECGARRGRARVMLPTPGGYDGSRGGPQHPDKRKAGGHAVCLQDAVHGLLPTPTASDGSGGPNPQPWPADNLRTAADRLPHPVAGNAADHGLLPTPRARDIHGGDYDPAKQAARRASTQLGGPNLPDVVQQHMLPAGKDDLMLLSAVTGERYGRYGAAVALWEARTGVAAPEPTVANDRGQWRLNPQLPEWMMGFPSGWITGLVGRGAALRLAGNAVVWQVAAAAYPLITADWDLLQGGDIAATGDRPVTRAREETSAVPPALAPGPALAAQLALAL